MISVRVFFFQPLASRPALPTCKCMRLCIYIKRALADRQTGHGQ